MFLEKTNLGKETLYKSVYDKSILDKISRYESRQGLDKRDILPFSGYDIWNHYEVSYLNKKGKPIVKCVEIIIKEKSKYIIESKSMKLYFNSLNQKKFNSEEDFKSLIQKDLSFMCESEVFIRIFDINNFLNNNSVVLEKNFFLLDNLDIDIIDYNLNTNFLDNKEEFYKEDKEVLYSHLLKTNCPVTNQPDWGTIIISYEGEKIKKESLLKYIISFRNHNGFHEMCVESIFIDLWNKYNLKKLKVYARYTRRGGIDINPFRYSKNLEKNINIKDIYKLNNLRINRQ